MITIRRGCFETNSSSVHSLSVMAEEDFEKWKKGEICIDLRTGKQVDKNEGKDNKDAYTYVEFVNSQCEFGVDDGLGGIAGTPQAFDVSGTDKRVVAFMYGVRY